MAGLPEGEIDSMDVETVLFNGPKRVLSITFVTPNGHEVKVHEALLQVTGRPAASVIARIRALNGQVIQMDQNGRMLDYVDALIDGTLEIINR